MAAIVSVEDARAVLKPVRYKVTGALAVGKTLDGKPEYVYRGGVMPQSIAPDSIAHLLDTGLIKPVE